MYRHPIFNVEFWEDKIELLKLNIKFAYSKVDDDVRCYTTNSGNFMRVGQHNMGQPTSCITYEAIFLFSSKRKSEGKRRHRVQDSTISLRIYRLSVETGLRLVERSKGHASDANTFDLI